MVDKPISINSTIDSAIVSILCVDDVRHPITLQCRSQKEGDSR